MTHQQGQEQERKDEQTVHPAIIAEKWWKRGYGGFPRENPPRTRESVTYIEDRGTLYWDEDLFNFITRHVRFCNFAEGKPTFIGDCIVIKNFRDSNFSVVHFSFRMVLSGGSIRLANIFPETESYEGYGVRPIVGTYQVFKNDILTIHDKFGEAEMTVLPKNANLERYDFMTSDEIVRASNKFNDELNPSPLIKRINEIPNEHDK